MMKDYHICLSVEEMDPDFARMKHALEKIANVTIVGLSGYSLAGFDIFICLFSCNRRWMINYFICHFFIF